MTRIYLIASAESEGTLYHIAEGCYDSNLTDRGWRQVKALEKYFSNMQIDGVYTSYLYRACATASAVCRPRGLAAVRREALREICLGEWEGRNWGNLACDEPRQVSYFKAALDKWQVEDAETPEQVQDRMLDAIRQIAAESDGKTVAVVSHDLAVRILLAGLQGVPLEKLGELPAEETAAISVIEAENGVLRVASRGETGHLRDEDDQAREKPRIEPDFDTSMYFQRLRWIEYGESMAEAVECVWQEAGEDRAFNRDILLEDAAMLATIIGYVQQEPAGFLQLGVEPGWITLLCTHPGCRNVGLGAQLLGQAVLAARAKGCDFLHIALPEKNQHRQFFLDYGFVPVGETREGREILEKDISFAPEFLSE